MNTQILVSYQLRKPKTMKTRTSLAKITCPKTMARHSRIACGTRLLPLLLLLTLPAAVQAQFNYTTNNGAITITGYTGHGGAVTIPDTINGLPVTAIGDSAFFDCTILTSVTIPNSVTNIGNDAFYSCTSLASLAIGNKVSNIGYVAFAFCTNLTSVTIPDSVTSIGEDVFSSCTSLTNVTIPDSVTYIGDSAFWECTSLTSVTIPESVTSIGNWVFGNCTSLISVTIPNTVSSIGSLAFYSCTSLASVTIPDSVTHIGDIAFYYCNGLNGVYFQGNAPSLGSGVFDGDNNTTVYYLPGTTGWGPTFGDLQTVLWKPRVLTSDACLGVRTNRFGFNIIWAGGQVVVVEACTNLANLTWTPVETNTLTGDSYYFSDPRWTNYPSRFYRLRSL
jgi:hypothetical protein